MSPELSAADLGRVADVLATAGEKVAGPLSADLIAGGRSNLTYRLSDGERRWVLRTPPRVGRTPSAHDVAREFRVVKALRDTEVPVARAVALCEDESLLGVPFAVTEFVDGLAIQSREQLDGLVSDGLDTHGLVRGLLGVLAALHAVDHVAIGLETFGRTGGYAARQLRRWSGQWELVGQDADQSLAARVLERLHGDVPTQASVGIVHGDYRIDNTLLDPETGYQVAAVVDWELSTIGDPVADVATMCIYRHPTLDLVLGSPCSWTSPALPDVATMAGYYEDAGGVRLRDWEFHLALAYFKIAVIAAGIDYRYRAGATTGPGFDTAGEAVPQYLALAWETLEGKR